MKIYLLRDKYIHIFIYTHIYIGRQVKKREDKERQREYETSKVSKSDVE